MLSRTGDGSDSESIASSGPNNKEVGLQLAIGSSLDSCILAYAISCNMLLQFTEGRPVKQMCARYGTSICADENHKRFKISPPC
jgi:hypothetical protein